MIEMIERFPPNIAAFSARGRVTREDYDRVALPAVEQALGRHDKLRCYYELRTPLPGSILVRSGRILKSASAICRAGSGSRWSPMSTGFRHAVNAFGFLMPAQVRVFPNSEASEARAWIAG
jgi:hypothetical protein